MSARVIANYLLADNRRNQRSFLIGTSTVIVIVLFLTFLENALLRANVIFVRLAEDSVGAFDFVVTADLSQRGVSPLLNYTQFKSSVDGLDILSGSSPRWLSRANVTRTLRDDGSINNTTITNNATSTSAQNSAIVLVANSTREREIGLANLWPHRELGMSECHVSATLLRDLNVRPNFGQQITLSVNLLDPNVISGVGGLGSSSGSSSSSQDGTSNSTDTQNGGGSSSDQSQQQPPSSVLPPQVDVPESQFDGLGSAQKQLLFAAIGAKVVNGTVTIDLATLNKFLNENGLLNPSVLCTVVDAIDATYGLYPPSLGNIVYIEQSFAQSIITSNLALLVPTLPLLNQRSVLPNSLLSGFRLEDYAIMAIAMLKDRFTIYDMSQQDRTAAITQAANKVMASVGYQYPIKLIDLLNQALALSQFINIFLNEIFFTVLVVLVLLAIILISSLLTTDAEEKTFEYGMLRMLGMHQNRLVFLLIMQSLMFSIPGVVCGLLICFMLYIPVGYYLANVVGSVIDVSFTANALALGIVCGIVLPIVGTVLPIKNSLSSTIRDALNMYHNSVFDSVLSVKRLENVGMSITQTVVALLLVVIGFLVYYVIPLSFVYQRLDVFFRVLTVILLGMVLGLVLLSQIVEPFLSRAAVDVLTLVGFDYQISQVVAKNLYAHSPRNRKTSVMFTLCLGYIVFVSTMFTLQINSLSQGVEWTLGADIVVTGPQFSIPLPEQRIRNYLDSVTDKPEDERNIDRIVLDYTFVTYPINDFFPVQGAWISRMASIVQPTVQIYGVERNFLKVALTAYAVTSEINTQSYNYNYTLNNGPDYIGALFASPIDDFVTPKSVGSHVTRQSSNVYGTNRTQAYTRAIPLLVSEAARGKGVIDAQSKLIMQVNYRKPDLTAHVLDYFALPAAMMIKLPAFPTISRLVTKKMPTLMSMDNFQRILGDVQSVSGYQVSQMSSEPVPKGLCLIKLRSNATVLQIQALVNSMNSLMGNDQITVVDLKTQVNSTQTAASLINIVFNIVAIVGVLLSFFVLLLSFTANVRENSWQLGVLRAIGLTEVTVTKIFIYEALAIVVSCIVLGLVLGILAAITVTLQNDLFSELPFQFVFPVTLFCVTVLLSTILASLGSYFPINEFNKKPIANALKGQ